MWQHFIFPYTDSWLIYFYGFGAAIQTLSTHWKWKKGYSKFVFHFHVKSFAIYIHKSVYFHTLFKIGILPLSSRRGKIGVKKYTERTVYKNLL